MVVWMVGGRGLPHQAGGAGGGVFSRLSAKLWKGYVDDEMSWEGWGGLHHRSGATSEWVTFQFMAVTIP